MKTNTVIAWYVLCGETGAPLVRCFSRNEARDLARSAGGRIGVLRVAK